MSISNSHHKQVLAHLSALLLHGISMDANEYYQH